MRFEFNDDSQKICNSVDVVNYGIQCDICGNKVLSVSNINGKRYCAGCYYKTFMKDNQKAEIDQLKQENEKLFLQLSKQEIDEHKPVYCTLAGTDCKYLGKIKELKQQLAEKDKEIERLKNLFELNNEVVINQGKEIFDLRVQVLQQKQKQNQTQLAIQELEKVKEWLEPKYFDYEQINYLSKIIDQQIKELKGEKDDNC